MPAAAEADVDAAVVPLQSGGYGTIYFFLDAALKLSMKMAHSEYNKERLTGKPFDDHFQNASKKKG